MALSPMMVQYKQIKEQYQDCIIFYRLGDFYEMFFDDAVTASRELELTLTGRDCGLEERAPMCGVPYHACEVYINRLIAKGYKVAICEQTSDPATSKGLVTRDIVRVITPGTVIDGQYLDETRNNFIASLYQGEQGTSICFADISTGHLSVFEPQEEGNYPLMNELYKFMPAEMICNVEPDLELRHFISDKLHCMISPSDPEDFTFSRAGETVLKHFNKKALSDVGVGDSNACVCALGGLLRYLYRTQFSGLEHLTRLDVYSEIRCLELDVSARRNLELCETMREKKKHGSLLGVLDKTKTAAGGRLLRAWIEQPLADIPEINRRLDAVSALRDNYDIRTRLIEELSRITDVERVMTKVVYQTAGGKELLSLARTLDTIPAVKVLLEQISGDYLAELHHMLDPLSSLCQLIQNAIDPECPFSIRDGGVIKLGFDATVDELRILLKDGKEIIRAMEQKEREATGIRTLKVGYNKVFGYYIEVSKSFVEQVPEHYIRRQTLTNGERYITGELKELENRILGASEKLAHLEYDLFCNIRSMASDALEKIQKNASALAQIDVLVALADVAEKNNYVRPTVDNGDVIDIKGGRHPVVEKMLRGDLFVPNDTYLDASDSRLMIVTGPNMAGKSTYMRQTALIALMAQMGSFVPAQSARIGVLDKIFTRVGASDDLASGQSTFMLEMSEVAGILKNATPRSLVIYDEIGRGTSTYDGMAIARAVLEYTANKNKLGAKCIFATHYHELTELEGKVDGVKNCRIAVKKRGDEIIFLRKIVAGAADESYGIEVAKLAGVEQEVIDCAKRVLAETIASAGKKPTNEAEQAVEQLSLLDDNSATIINELRRTNAETLSPLEALNMLYKLTRLSRGEE